METLNDIEAWALRYVSSDDLAVKMAPGPLPERWRDGFAPRRVIQPGRPQVLRLARKGDRIPKPEAMHEKRHRARALHAFWHHELQAAELMCWAVLAFADAEREFRQGLLRVALDEIRHMQMYQQHIEALGHHIGEFGVRDWFWSRVPACETKLSFVAVMGMGLEAANLEHAHAFAARFRAAGDHEGADIQDRIAEDELQHVRFGTHWFNVWSGGCDFDTWVQALPKPWSPWVLRGTPLATDLRLRAGMAPAFVAALDAYVPEPKGR